jgi:hypothetical protein
MLLREPLEAAAHVQEALDSRSRSGALTMALKSRWREIAERLFTACGQAGVVAERGKPSPIAGAVGRKIHVH